MKKDNSRKIKCNNLYLDTKDDIFRVLITLVTSEPMQTEIENRQIRIYIKSKDKKKKEIPITALADFFQHIQVILYQVCDDIIENECRQSGRYPDYVKENCELVLKKIELNSADAVVALSQTQSALPFPEFPEFKLTIGEQAIIKTKDIIEVVREKDDILPDLSPIIENKDRRYRILSEVDAIWPDTGSKFNYDVAVGKDTLHRLSPKQKPKIKAALKKEITQTEKTIFGRLIELNLSKKHTCQIETEEGKYDCKYSPKLVDIIKNNGGEFVSISGKLTDSRTITLLSKNDLQNITTLPIYQIKIDDHSVNLIKPIGMTVKYDKENDLYFVENEYLNVFVVNNELKEAIDSIKEQIGILWQEFVNEDPSRLTDSAIDLRKTLIETIGAH